MAEMQLDDWLDDLCVRFIINLPDEEANNVERLCFQVEEAQWFYEDFIRPLDPRLPSLSLKAFSLRIFQHCPVFRQWDVHHRTQAFADFMAYKQRVPVRGAIMLNAAMDKVVLVKGWKKGANWSFPRGKINKDEKDLDCAVREVYEETGFDIAAAGLVKDEKEMKSIEITMREQHMRLYVFRGVPEDTHFEPRTRKEISKIEWYRLTDLPTLGKNKQADGIASGNSSNANDNNIIHINETNRLSPSKFYMVAPFLGPLKKWIQQQRKKDGIRYSSGLAAPPIIAEEESAPVLQILQKPSDLPEVTAANPVEQPLVNQQPADASQLGQPLFGISPAQPAPHLAQADAAKSTALLSLLKGPSAAENGAIAQTSSSFSPPQLSHHVPEYQPGLPDLAPSGFPIQQPQRPTAIAPAHQPWPLGLTAPEQPAFLQNPGAALPFQGQVVPGHLASRPPYPLTSDPQFAPGLQHEVDTSSAGPPASSLPKLTHHTKTLLGIFAAKPPAGPALAQQPPAAAQHTLLDVFPNVGGNATRGHQPLAPDPVAAILSQQKQPGFATVVSVPPSQGIRPATAATGQVPSTTQQKNLLSLFSAPAPPATQAVPMPVPVEQACAELAATPEHRPKNEVDLLALLRKQKAEQATTQRHPGSTSKEGKTSANMSGPLNQPSFDVVAKTHKGDPNGTRRSPLTTNRTLFDPNQPGRVKVLARPETPRQPASKSPRAAKAKTPQPSPKRHAKPSQKEPAKPFQPQILKRPQTSESGPSSEPVAVKAASMSREASASTELPLALDTPSTSVGAAEAQKQTLLSLFGREGSRSSTSTTKTGQTPTRMVSPLSISQTVGGKADGPLSGVEPTISTRPRVESVVSAGSAGTGPSRPGVEKRQTAAEDKAFLLGMLGKIAQEQS